MKIEKMRSWEIFLAFVTKILVDGIVVVLVSRNSREFLLATRYIAGDSVSRKEEVRLKILEINEIYLLSVYVLILIFFQRS